MNIRFKVVCINDKNRPDGIPINRWVKKDQVYTVIEVARLNIQGGMLGFKLEEINIDDCFPYQYFAAFRFLPLLPKKDDWIEETLDRLLEEAKKEEKEQVQVL
jgi:hypothetical protein